MSLSFIVLAITVAIELALWWLYLSRDDPARYQRRPRPTRAYH